VRREACRHESRAGSDVDDGLLAGQLRPGCELLDHALVVDVRRIVSQSRATSSKKALTSAASMNSPYLGRLA
jgi:hypothetical protein